MTLDTVPRPTPARAATASRVGRLMVPILPDDLGVPGRADLGQPLQRLVVHPYDPEALAVAPRPLEVGHERPGEVALERDPGVDRLAAGAQVRLEVGAPLLVADPPVLQHVLERGAVLRDDQRDARVLPRHPG